MVLVRCYTVLAMSASCPRDLQMTLTHPTRLKRTALIFLPVAEVRYPAIAIEQPDALNQPEDRWIAISVSRVDEIIPRSSAPRCAALFQTRWRRIGRVAARPALP